MRRLGLSNDLRVEVEGNGLRINWLNGRTLLLGPTNAAVVALADGAHSNDEIVDGVLELFGRRDAGVERRWVHSLIAQLQAYRILCFVEAQMVVSNGAGGNPARNES